eukprot:7975-Heterococcus_DN1.PRE.1
MMHWRCHNSLWMVCQSVLAVLLACWPGHECCKDSTPRMGVSRAVAQRTPRVTTKLDNYKLALM